MILGKVYQSRMPYNTWHGFTKVACRVILGTVFSKSHAVVYQSRMPHVTWHGFNKVSRRMLTGNVYQSRMPNDT